MPTPTEHLGKCVVVEFLKSMPPYNVGETAGFSEVEAERLLHLPGGVVKLRPDIKGKWPTRSPGQDMPAFSMQQFAGVMRGVVEEATKR